MSRPQRPRALCIGGDAGWCPTIPIVEVTPHSDDDDHRSVLRTALIVALTLAIAAGVAFAVTIRLGSVSRDEIAATAPSPPRTPAVSPAVLPIDVVAARSVDRVVTIEVAAGDTSVALGTGWLLDDHGDYVTNQHVVADQRSLRIVDRQGGSHPGVVMGVDTADDIAVVRAQDAFGRVPLAVDRAAEPPLPEAVAVLASARATGHGDRTTETLVRLHQTVPLDAAQQGAPIPGQPSTYPDMMVLKGAVIYRGNSGGPVLDQRGAVIGIVTLASETTPQAFAIPIGRVFDQLQAFAAKA